jgi:plastocyanin
MALLIIINILPENFVKRRTTFAAIIFLFSMCAAWFVITLPVSSKTLHFTEYYPTDTSNRHTHKNQTSSGTGKAVYLGEGQNLVELRTFGIDLNFDIEEIHANAGQELTIRYINESEMIHNILILKAEEDIRPVGIASAQYFGNQWVPESKIDRIIAYSKLLNPGESEEITITVPPPGVYPYICTYSNHWTTMVGRIISSE